MDDLDRLFALVDLISDPETAKKNAAVLRSIRAEKKENAQLFKDVHAATGEQEKQLAQIVSQRNALNESKAKFADKETVLGNKERALAASVRALNRVEKAAGAGLKEREDAVGEREVQVAKKEKAAVTKKTALDTRETEIRERGANLASAVTNAEALGA